LLWSSLRGGHDDDRAVGQDQFDETWCWLVLKGASIIQDRLDQQIEYIRKTNMDNKSN
jgi:glycerophosphoryl diester phosphodiesterase